MVRDQEGPRTAYCPKRCCHHALSPLPCRQAAAAAAGGQRRPTARPRRAAAAPPPPLAPRRPLAWRGAEAPAILPAVVVPPIVAVLIVAPVLLMPMVMGSVVCGQQPAATARPLAPAAQLLLRITAQEGRVAVKI